MQALDIAIDAVRAKEGFGTVLVWSLAVGSPSSRPDKNREKSGKQTGKRDPRTSKTPIKQGYYTSVSRKCSTTELTAQPDNNLGARARGRKNK